jgi:hypothetical protein
MSPPQTNSVVWRCVGQLGDARSIDNPLWFGLDIHANDISGSTAARLYADCIDWLGHNCVPKTDPIRDRAVKAIATFEALPLFP